MGYALARDVALFILNALHLFKIRAIKDNFAVPTAQFHGFSLQGELSKNGVFSPFRRVFFRINISMFILDLIFVRLPVHFIQYVFKSSLLGLCPFVPVPEYI